MTAMQQRLIVALFLALSGSCLASRISCLSNHTSCEAAFAVSGKGCCVFPNAVCCSNKQTCCPEGTDCTKTERGTDCVSESGPAVKAKSVCKPGARHALSTFRKNVIVLGDSVSIGYTPTLRKALDYMAVVQHSPDDVDDGGAEETAYGLQCLEYFVRGRDGRLLEPDVMLFNFGLHDGPLGNETFPGQQGNSSVYADELDQIVDRLKDYYVGKKTQLLFALTTPMLCDVTTDGNVMTLNAEAGKVMQRHGVPTVDTHTPLVKQCGPVPQDSCFGRDKCFCPHCPRDGYKWLGENVLVPKLLALLQEKGESTGENTNRFFWKTGENTNLEVLFQPPYFLFAFVLGFFVLAEVACWHLFLRDARSPVRSPYASIPTEI